MTNTIPSSPTTHAECTSPGGMSTESPGESSTSESDAAGTSASASVAAGPLHDFGRMTNLPPPSATPTRLYPFLLWAWSLRAWPAEKLRAFVRGKLFFFFFFSSLSQRSVVPTATSTARARPLFLSLSHSLSSRRPAHPARAKAAHIASELITSPSLAGSQEIFGPKCRGGEGLAEAEEAEAASRPRPALAGAWRADCGGEPPPTLLRKPPASERAAHRGASTKRRARESIVARRAFFGEICCWRNL